MYIIDYKMEDNVEMFKKQGIVSFTFNDIKTDLNDKNEEKKSLIGLPKWSKITLDNCDCFDEGSCIAVITGEKSDLTIIDFDDSDTYETLVREYPELKNYKTIKTNQGFHVWCKYNPLIKNSTNVLKNYKDVDFRNDGGFAITFPTKYKLLDGRISEYTDLKGEILPFPKFINPLIKSESLKDNKKPKKSKVVKKDDDLSSLSDESFEGGNLNAKKEKPKKPKKENKYEVGSINMDIQNLLDLIDVKYIDDYSSWIKIVYACKNLKLDKQDIKDLSQKSNKYDEDTFENVYSYHYPAFTIGTIRHFAKLSNEEEYMKIVPFNIYSVSDRYLAELFYNLYGTDYVLQDNKIFIYHNESWDCDDELLKLKGNIQRKIIPFLKQRQIQDINNADDDLEKMKEFTDLYNKCFKKVSTTSETNAIATSFKYLISLEQSKKEDIFDKKPFIFSFLNKGFDIQTGKEYVIKKEDYITQNTKFDYKPHTKEQYALIKKLMEQIFPDEEVRKCYISVLYSGLIGQQFEYFIVANGCGRNGKGLINELFYSLLGDMYAYNLPVSILTTALKCDGSPNPTLANMENKRWVISSEPDEKNGTKLVMSSIKKITGDQILSARRLYSHKTEVCLTNTQSLECNSKLQFSGKIDESVLNRIRDIPFISHFTSDTKLWDKEKNIFPVNPLYKTTEFKKNHRVAFFHYIIDVVFKDIIKTGKYEIIENEDGNVISPIPYFPSVILERSKEYCFESDLIYAFMKDNYEFTQNEDDIVKAKDFYNEFQNSEIYINLDKTEKSDLTYKKVFADFSQKISTKDFFKLTYNNKGTRHRSVFVGLKWIDQDLEDKDEPTCLLKNI